LKGGDCYELAGNKQEQADKINLRRGRKKNG